MMSLLIRLHFGYSLGLNTAIGPENIKVFSMRIFRALDHQFEIIAGSKVLFYRFERQTEIENLFCYKSYNKILGSTTVDNKSLILLEFGIIFVVFDSNCFRKLFHLLIISDFLLFFCLKVPINVFGVNS